jgi:hypothetical protein
LESYAGMVPEALDSLLPEERHQVYKMLRLKVIAHVDRTLEVSGMFAGGLTVSNSETVSIYRSQNTKTSSLVRVGFRAVLNESGDEIRRWEITSETS